MEAMTETQTLLGKIAALRQRLEQAHGATEEICSAVAHMAAGGPLPASLHQLASRVQAGGEHDLAVDAALRPVTGSAAEGPRDIPRQLTARARELLERGRHLLAQLRQLADTFAPEDDASSAAIPRNDPLAVLYRRLVALTTTALRSLTSLPDTATAQLPLCDGPDAIFELVAARLATLQACVARSRKEGGRTERLAHLLLQLSQGEEREIVPFLELAGELVAEAEEGQPLRFLYDPASPPRLVACHSLNVARVVAHVARHHPDYRHRAVEPVLAALLHDVGMLCLPAEILMGGGPLTEEQRRLVESHSRLGADLATPLQPDSTWLPQAILGHHERADGTGYPDGLRDYQQSALTRLLAVCDVYAALAAPRPHRAALDTRTALTDTLLLAEKELLDRDAAQMLLHLSFYPVGSVVELADGSVGAVVAAPPLQAGAQSAARPVLALLLESDGSPCATPRHLDLGHSEGYSIVRSLPARERVDRLGLTHPEWLA